MTELPLQFKKVLLLVNPISGDIDKNDIDKRVADFFQGKDIKYEICWTSGENDKETLAEKLKSFSPDVVYAAGGDGTVNLVAELLRDSPLILGIIPLGSGNGLAKDLTIPQNDVEGALELLASGKIIHLDTLYVNNHFFMHLCDLGFNAHVVKLFTRSKKRGWFNYARFTCKEFFRYSSFKYKLTSKDYSRKGRAFMITCANSQRYGSGLMINPTGKVNDGKFEVIVVKDFSWYKGILMIILFLFRKINFSDIVETISCTEAVIEVKKKKTLQYDGELADKVREIRVKIASGNVKVLVPLDFE